VGYEVDFLPVGDGEKNGDAIALRFGNLSGARGAQRVVVIDGGFQDSGKALVEHVQTYYKTDTIDLVISTHPDADHISGLEVVLKESKVGQLWMHLPWNHAKGVAGLFKDGRVTDQSVREALRRSLDAAYSLDKLARAKGIPIVEPFTGTKDASQQLLVLGPTQAFYESQLPLFRGTPEPKAGMGVLQKVREGVKEVVQRIAETWDYETLDDTGETSPENNSSAIILLSSEDRRVLFTADAGIPALSQAADALNAIGLNHAHISFIQVPHHGSRRNVGPQTLDRLVGPRRLQDVYQRTAIVSASKDGQPKHPAKKVTNAFRRRGTRVYATQGKNVRHAANAPPRDGWIDGEPLPFFTEVED